MEQQERINRRRKRYAIKGRGDIGISKTEYSWQLLNTTGTDTLLTYKIGKAFGQWQTAIENTVVFTEKTASYYLSIAQNNCCSPLFTVNYSGFNNNNKIFRMVKLIGSYRLFLMFIQTRCFWELNWLMLHFPEVISTDKFTTGLSHHQELLYHAFTDENTP